MSKHPRLDYLVGLPDSARDYRDWVLKGYPWDWRGQKESDKLQRFGLLLLLSVEPSGPGHGQMGTGRVGYHQVPALIENGNDITGDVEWAGGVAGQ